MGRRDLYDQLNTKTINQSSLAPDIVALHAEIYRLQNEQPTTRLDPKTIVRSPYQPRKYFDPIKQAQLTANIKEFGILQNLVVRLINGIYELVAGERRLIAALDNNLPDVPVSIFELSDRDARRWALAENIQRENLNPLEETRAILNLLAVELGIESTEEVKSILYRLHHLAQGKSGGHNVMTNLEEIQSTVIQTLDLNAKGMTIRSFVGNRLPLLSLPEEIIEAMMNGLEYTKAKAIAKVEDVEQRADLLRSAVEERMPLSEINKQIKIIKEKPEQHQPEYPEHQLLQLRYKQVSIKLNKSPIWENAKKRKSLEKLLTQIEALMEDYST